MSSTCFKYNWLSKGDIGASATIIFDNLTILTFISILLQFGYQFPVEIILNKIIPGTVFGVLIGNILCVWLGFRLAKRKQRNVTAVPFGLDAPSAIGFVVCVIGPSFIMAKQQGMADYDAGIMAWYTGAGGLFILGLIKLFCSIFASKIKAYVPPAALLGGIGGVAIAFIGFIPLIAILQTPAVGLASMGLMLFTMFANVRLPFNMSGIPATIIVGTILYYILTQFNLSGAIPNLSLHISFLLPMPNIGFLEVMSSIVSYIPLIIPFALLVVFGTMSVAESSACVGENYRIKSLVIVDSIATIAAALCGGIAQTTPYAGFPAYKKLDARAGFLIINIIFVGIGGIFGLVGFLVHLIPEAAIAPILLFVAFEIIAQGFIHCDKKYIVPILFAFFPSIARLLQVKLTDGSLVDVEKLQADMFNNTSSLISEHLALVIMGNGFIITGILWATILVFAIDRKYIQSGICCFILAILSYFGIIHSVFINGQLYLPSQLPQAISHLPLELSLGYSLIGIFALLSGLSCKNKL